MPEHIPKKKNLNFDNSSNISSLSSISKFSKSSDNLEYYQSIANSSSKVSQLQKFQDTANENPIQLQNEDNLNDQETNSESNILQLKDPPTTGTRLATIPQGVGEFGGVLSGDDSDLNDQENNPEWNKLSKEQRSALLDEFLNGNISPVLATYIKRKGIDSELPEPEDLLGTETVQTHLNQFRIGSGGGSRFDTPKNFEKNKEEWGLGREGGAFIATKTEALAAQSKAQKKVTNQEVAEGELPGLWSLASDLAVPPQNWIDKSLGGEQDNPNHKMIRTDIPNPDKFNLAMVKGNEMSAYQKEWLAGGKTLGGQNEAKIKKMNKVKFISEIIEGNVKPIPVEFEETPKKNKKELQSIESVSLTDDQGKVTEIFNENSPEYLYQLRHDAAFAQSKLINTFSKPINQLSGCNVSFENSKDPLYQEGDWKKTLDEKINEIIGDTKGKEKEKIKKEHQLFSDFEEANKAYPTKKRERIEEKKARYDGDYRKFTDISRISLIFDTPKLLLDGVQKLESITSSAGMSRAGTAKNRFKKMTDDNYRDILLNYRVPLGNISHLVEIQLHLKGMHDAKSAKKNKIKNNLYKQLNSTAKILLNKDNTPDNNGDLIELPEKARIILQKISDADEIEKLQGGISGHDLFIPKRFLAEREELKVKKEGKGDTGLGEYKKIFSEISKKEFYDPAYKEIENGNEKYFEEIKNLFQ